MTPVKKKANTMEEGLVRLPRGLRRRLEAAARREGLPVNELVRIAVVESLHRQRLRDQRYNEAMRQMRQRRKDVTRVIPTTTIDGETIH
jgi:hypothetical protein